MKPETNVSDRAFAAQQCRGDLLTRSLLSLIAIGQKQDTRSGLGTGGCIACTDQLFQFFALLIGQYDLNVFAHAM